MYTSSAVSYTRKRTFAKERFAALDMHEEAPASDRGGRCCESVMPSEKQTQSRKYQLAIATHRRANVN